MGAQCSPEGACCQSPVPDSGGDVDGGLVTKMSACFQPGPNKAFANQDLLVAAQAGDAEGVRRALRLGASVETRRPICLRYQDAEDADSPCAAWVSPDVAGLTPLMRAAKAGSAEACCVLLGAGADIDATDHDGTMPLHFAAASGSEDVCRFLIEWGALPDAADDDGLRPIDYVPTDLVAEPSGIKQWREILSLPEAASRSRREPEALGGQGPSS